MHKFDRSRYLDPLGTKRDWCPGAPIHVVVIPKAHVTSLLSAEARDGALLSSMVTAIQEAARTIGLDMAGFFMRANAAAPGVSPHMHWHVMGPGVDPPLGHS